jgi:hypothetical protein
MKRVVLTVLFGMTVVAVPIRAEGETKTYQGSWTNLKYRTNGTMQCVATPHADGKWTATFSGTFQGRRFSYDVEFQSRPAQNQTALAGKAVIDNRNYECTGVMRGNTLAGRYRADNGYFGEFLLRESAQR